MDAAWLVTPEIAYNNFVRKILPGVLEELRYNKDRTFTQADIYFFKKWYSTIDDGDKEAVKQLV